ncbi:MAG: glycosyltransferase family 2 protein [Candidatus Micrarchaeota archaeon]|nr:glycosyltransferase family 2 protein [Candidatus Micrarchaeota archaeon]
MRRPHVSVVIPTLNEEHNIGSLLRQVSSILRGYNYEIIVVDGHSSDDTVKIARPLCTRVVYDSLGKGSALTRGIRAARGDVIISMDADLSNRPTELKLLIAGIETGYDICMGSRFLTGGGSEDMPFVRKLGNWCFVKVVNFIYGSRYTDLCYGYRSFAREIPRRLKLDEKGFGIEAEISIKAVKKHMKVLEVPSYEKKRESGEAKLMTFRDGWAIFRTILRNA